MANTVLDDKIHAVKDRLSGIISKYPGGIRELSEKTQISITQLRRYAKGEGEPGLSSILALQHVLGTQAIELRVNHPERAYGTEEQADSVRTSIASPSVDTPVVSVPLVDVNHCEDSREIAAAPAYQINTATLRGLGVTDYRKLLMVHFRSDCMAPTIPPRSLCMLDRGIAHLQDGIQVLYLRGQYLVRRVQLELDGDVSFLCDNRRYSSRVYNRDDLDVKVIGTIRFVGHYLG